MKQAMREANRLLRPRSDGGFSLLEIMIAVMILALMGGLVTTFAFPNLWKTKRARAQMECDTIKEAINLYRLSSKSGKLPEVSEFPACITEPSDQNGGQPYLDPDKLTDGKLLDPWDNEYVYVKDRNSFEVISYGEDGVQGGEGDAADISSKRSNSSEGSGGGGGSGRR
jgi:general secretion pathway protein G